MTTNPFLRATTWDRVRPGVYAGEVEAEWYQGRGAFGGILAAGIVRALRREIPDEDRLPRSLTVHFAAPAVAGPIELHTVIEREGTRVTHASARVLQNGKPAVVATSTFAASRRDAIHYDRATMPPVPSRREVQVVPPNPLFPTFVQFFDLAFAHGGIPYTGSADAKLGGWTRLKDPLVLDTPLAAAYLDAWPPGVLAMMTEPRAAASVDLTMHFFEPLPLADARADAWHLLTVESRWAGEGYTEDVRELWTEDGRRLAHCRQLIALLN